MNAKVCICDWPEVALELYESCREWHAWKIVEQLYAENLKSNVIKETLKDFFACLQYVCEKGTESLEKNWFCKLYLSIGKIVATKVSNVYIQKGGRSTQESKNDVCKRGLHSVAYTTERTLLES